MEIALYYQDIYMIVVAIVCMVCYRSMATCNAECIINNSMMSKIATIIIWGIMVLAIGLRPLHWIFVDTLNYARSYEMGNLDEHNDLGIWWIAKLCHAFGWPVKVWFLIIAFIYFLAYLLSAKNLSEKNAGCIYVTFLAAFSTFAYATNGIRNGMGLGLLMLGMTYFLQDNKNLKIAVPLFIYAVLTHKSSVLPLACFFAAYYIVDVKKAIIFWTLAVLISVTVGDSVANVFVGLGFDDRMDGYLTADVVEGVFSHVGFRWDFLLYSVMPLVLGYHVIKVHNVHDKVFETLLGTYVLSNAFWVMIIRAQFSDRFAYLSWFLYPFVIAYPLVKMDIWGYKQGKYAQRILLAHLAFTLFMHFIYYGYIKHGMILS